MLSVAAADRVLQRTAGVRALRIQTAGFSRRTARLVVWTRLTDVFQLADQIRGCSCRRDCDTRIGFHTEVQFHVALRSGRACSQHIRSFKEQKYDSSRANKIIR